MKDVVKMVEGFKIKRFCETIYGYNPHSAIIGEWVRWWLRDSRLGERRMRRIINPGIAITHRKKRVIADLLFAEQARKDSDFFKILGVAEVENSPSKFLKKLQGMSSYEQIDREKEDKKFPDLKFSLMCCKTTMKPQNKEAVTDSDLIEKLITKSKMYSKDSEIFWILYLLKYARMSVDYSFRVSEYVRGYQYFWYNSSFYGSEFYIYKNGKRIAHSEVKF